MFSSTCPHQSHPVVSNNIRPKLYDGYWITRRDLDYRYMSSLHIYHTLFLWYQLSAISKYLYIICHMLVTSSTVPCIFVAQFNALFLMLHVLKHYAISKQNNGSVLFGEQNNAGRLQAAFIIWPTQLGSLLWKLSFALPV